MTTKTKAPVLEKCRGCGMDDMELYREKGQAVQTAKCVICWGHEMHYDHLREIANNQADRLLGVKMAKPKLYVTCHKTQREFTGPEVDFLDVCSDIAGRDLVTFYCPECKETHQSLVIAREHDEEEANE